MKSTFNKYKLLTVLLILAAPVLAADVEGIHNKVLDWTFSNIILVLAGVVVIGAFLALARLVGDLLQQQKMLYMKEEMEAQELAKAKEPSFFNKLYKRAWNLVPMEKEADIKLGHSFDGIHELDNKLPPWWVYLFYLTIIWAVAYLYVSHFSENRVSQDEEYVAEMLVAKEQQRAFLKKQANSVDESNVVMLEDVASLEAGLGIFTKNCASCHAADGGGVVGLGPNFTDEYWIHGGSISDIFKTIKYGAPNGMQAWKAQISPSDMQRVASYIKSLKGTEPLNPKEPEGELYVEKITMNEGESK